MIVLYTDGSALGNPGPGGYACILTYAQSEKELSGAYRYTTNNRMELMAVIAGLEAIKRTDLPIEVVSDSRYVVESVSKRWVFGWERKGFVGKANPDLWQRYLVLHRKLNPVFRWIRGHSGHPFNERCDRLAVLAARGANLPADLGYEREHPYSAAR